MLDHQTTKHKPDASGTTDIKNQEPSAAALLAEYDTKRKQRARHQIQIGLVIFAILVGVMGSFWFINQRLQKQSVVQQPSITIPANIPFPVYIPSSKDKAYSVDGKTVEFKDGVLSYVLHSQDRTLMVVQQPKPKVFDFEMFYDKSLNAQDLLSPFGIAKVGTLNGRLMVSVVTDKTWLTMTTTEYFNNQELFHILSTMRQH